MIFFIDLLKAHFWLLSSIFWNFTPARFCPYHHGFRKPDGSLGAASILQIIKVGGHTIAIDPWGADSETVK